ncbi:MAG: bifunctional riboflavin kinase/FAD synthetase [Acidobacteriota bacterium]|nr:bifunctional riboflavin kinase/FAD synthetase [Acidobacteriota bacterium]
MIYRSIGTIPDNFGPCALTIGNFDGVHAAHRHIMRRVVEIARAHGWNAAVLTFDPHPTKLVAPDRAPHLLTTPERRSERMQDVGIDRILILPFTPDIAKLTPEEFVRDILVEKLQARAVLVGDNFRFGNRASGNTATLKELGERYGFETEIAGAIRLRGRTVSSSDIRKLIEAGNVALACRLLERPYALEGKVAKGHGIGTKQTVPTLNLETAAEVLPATGVYVTRTQDLEAHQKWNSITNVGFRPTFDGVGLTIESYLLSPFMGATPNQIRVEFLHRIREERKFPSAEALKAQIMRDVGRAQVFFRRTESLRPRDVAVHTN